MAIKPLETRLDEVTAAVSADPRLPDEEQELPDPLPVPELDVPEDDPVQVAGLASGLRALLTPGAKMKDAPVQVAPAQVQAPQQINVPQPAPPPRPRAVSVAKQQ